MLLNVLMALTVIMVTARLVGILFARLHQPSVMGEVVGGLLLGPSVLGRLSPEAAAFLLPPAATPFLSVIAQLGVILYMFLVGLELDLPALRGRIAITLTISLASIVVPFALGIALAWRLNDVLAPDGVAFTSFALFLGVSMAITAFPVLARILGDRGLQRTDIGVLALTCAAVNDAVAWCLLAFVVSVTRATSVGAIATAGLTAIYVALMLTAGRSAMIAVAARFETAKRIGEQSLALLLAAVLLSAVATEFIGIHAIFGAFLFGAIIPRDSLIATHVNEQIEGIVRVMFLPAFFAFTGLRTEVGLVQTAGDWLLCLIIIAVATAGKFGGTLLAARIAGLDWRNSAILGTLMNTRGLVELIVLNIGLDLGVITPRLFTMLVIMALVTTFMTSPILSWLNLREEPRKPSDPRGSSKRT